MPFSKYVLKNSHISHYKLLKVSYILTKYFIFFTVLFFAKVAKCFRGLGKHFCPTVQIALKDIIKQFAFISVTPSGI